MAISRMFRSEDASAPELKYVKGSLIALLKAVLVNGYGATPSLGWTLEFEDLAANLAVFRMKGGTRTYIQVDDSAVGNTILGQASVYAYDTMSSVRDGIGPCPSLTEVNSNKINYSNGTAATIRPWVIIGDDSGFYFFSAAQGTKPYQTNTGTGLIFNAHYIGDYVPFVSSYKNIFCLSLSASQLGNNLFYPSANLAVKPGSFLIRDTTDEFGSVGFGIGSGTSYGSAQFGNNVDLSPLNGSMIYCNTTIHTSKKVIGKLPGLYNVLHSFKPTMGDNDIRFFTEKDGEREYALITTGYSNNWMNYSSQQKFMITLGQGFRNVQ